MREFLGCLGIALAISLIPVCRVYAAPVSVNLIAVNARDTPKEVEVKFDLPQELSPEDILDTGALKLDYNVDKGVYVATGKFNFEPKESRTFKITIKDVFFISEDEINILRVQLDRNLQVLEKEEVYPAAQQTAERLKKELDFIVKQQQSYSDNINRRIEEYRANVQTLEKLRNNIYNLDYLRYQSRALNEIADLNKTVKFVLEVRNPSLKKEKTVVHKHYLPAEIRSEQVIDKKGFEVRFDEKKGRSYLTKEEKFKPGEVKKYELLIKDIWQFPLMKLDDLSDRALIAQQELNGTIYEESSKYLLDKIMNIIEAVRNSQSKEALSIKEHIGLFRMNEKRYDEAWEDFQRIEEMIAIVRAKKLEELESKKVKNVLTRLKALRGLSALADSLFKQSISITVTWRIIMGAIIFVAFFTTIHFFLWSKRSKTMGEDLAPKGREGITVVPKPGEGSDEDDS